MKIGAGEAIRTPDPNLGKCISIALRRPVTSRIVR